MATEKQTPSANALSLAVKLHALLLAHGERNWIRGVTQVAAFLEEKDVASAASSYKAMLSGNGSFSDFYIHAEDFEERRRLNKPLDQLRDGLWTALGL